MSYIPDFRSEENTKHLNEVDRAFLFGYHRAIDDALNLFDNMKVYIHSEIEEELFKKMRIDEIFKDWMDSQEVEAVCSVFENADYIPEDVDIIDVSRPFTKKENDEQSI